MLCLFNLQSWSKLTCVDGNKSNETLDWYSLIMMSYLQSYDYSNFHSLRKLSLLKRSTDGVKPGAKSPRVWRIRAHTGFLQPSYMSSGQTREKKNSRLLGFGFAESAWEGSCQLGPGLMNYYSCQLNYVTVFALFPALFSSLQGKRMIEDWVIYLRDCQFNLAFTFLGTRLGHGSLALFCRHHDQWIWFD